MTGAALGEAFDATANQATRDLRQDAGQRAVLALHAIVRNARVHGEDNSVFSAPIEQLQKAIADLLATDGAFELRIAADAVYLNRQEVRFTAALAQLVSLVREELAGRDLAGLSARASPDDAELRAFVGLFTQRSESLGPLRAFSALTLQEGRAEPESAVAGRGEARHVEVYSHAVLFVDRTFVRLRAGQLSLSISAGSRIVQDLVELQRESPLRFLQLARTKAGGAAYWGYHAANVAVLGISFAARLGMAKRRRHDLGMAALLHDVGMAAVPLELLGKEEAFTPREIAAVRSAPLLAARALFRDREMHPAALERARAAFECHLDGGAPAGAKLGALGRVLAICEAYDALTTTRPHRRAYAHGDALRVMGTELAHRFDPKLLELFPAVVEPLV